MTGAPGLATGECDWLAEPSFNPICSYAASVIGATRVSSAGIQKLMLDPAKRQRLRDRVLRAAEDLASELDRAASTGFEEPSDISSKAFVDDCMAILNEGLTDEELKAREKQIHKFWNSVHSALAAKEVRSRQEQYKKVMKSRLSEEAYAEWLGVMELKFVRELSALEESPDPDAQS